MKKCVQERHETPARMVHNMDLWTIIENNKQYKR